MNFRLRVVDGRDLLAELSSLRAWLSREDSLRGRVHFEPEQPVSGTMGGISDALIVAVSGGGAVTVLAKSLQVWLQHRRSDVTVEVRDTGGRSVIVTAKNVSDAASIIQQTLNDSQGFAVNHDVCD